MLSRKLLKEIKSILPTLDNDDQFLLRRLKNKLSATAKSEVNDLIAAGESFPKNLYDSLYKVPVCLTCGSPVRFINFKCGYSQYCSHKCINTGNSPAVQARLATMTQRYGVPYTAQSKKLLRKMQKTTIQRYGVEHTSMLKENREKAQQTLIDKYGTHNQWEIPEIAEKTKRTNLERYGVEHVFQNPEIHHKQQISAFKIKEKVIGGKLFQYQGYEDTAIQYFVDKGVNPKNILTGGDIPKTFEYSIDRKNKVYIPDLYVKYKGKWWVIEVKSDYTAGILNNKPSAKNTFRLLKKKSAAVVSAGFRFRLFIVLVDQSFTIIKNVHEKTRKDCLRLVQ